MTDHPIVGFIGLGDQGAPMAAAIAQRYELHVWARRETGYQALDGVAYMRADGPVALAAAVDVLCVCVRNDADLDGLLEDDAVLEALAQGALINHATGDPSQAERFFRICADAGVGFLDAPVSGGRPGAAARSLTCFVGGDAAVLDACRPVIACHSASIFHMGTAGAGQMAKLCNNGLTISNLRSVVEVFALAEQAELSLPALQAAFEHSSGGSFILQALGTKITPDVAAHIAELNRTDIREFADAMAQKGLRPEALLEWGLKGPDGLEALVQKLAPKGAAEA